MFRQSSPGFRVISTGSSSPKQGNNAVGTHRARGVRRPWGLKIAPNKEVNTFAPSSPILFGQPSRRYRRSPKDGRPTWPPLVGRGTPEIPREASLHAKRADNCPRSAEKRRSDLWARRQPVRSAQNHLETPSFEVSAPTKSGCPWGQVPSHPSFRRRTGSSRGLCKELSARRNASRIISLQNPLDDPTRRGELAQHSMEVTVPLPLLLRRLDEALPEESALRCCSPKFGRNRA